MSSWLRPTTADVGLRSFAATKARLFEEQLQVCRITSSPQRFLQSHSPYVCLDGSIPTHDDANGLLLVKWLEEVLFMDEVEQKWLVDCSIK